MKSLPGGASVELVGVSPHPSGPGTWFSPDGRPLPAAPYFRANVHLQPGPGQLGREFVVRKVRIPAGADFRWDVPASASFASGTLQGGGGRDVPGLTMVAVTLPGDSGRGDTGGHATCTVRFGVAAGRWSTDMEAVAGGSTAGSSERGKVIFGGSHPSEGGTGITVSHSSDPGGVVRVVAVDREGKEHTPSRARSQGFVGGFQQLEVGFDVPPEKLTGFRFQTRPFEWATFERVALQPFVEGKAED